MEELPGDPASVAVEEEEARQGTVLAQQQKRVEAEKRETTFIEIRTNKISSAGKCMKISFRGKKVSGAPGARRREETRSIYFFNNQFYANIFCGNFRPAKCSRTRAT